MNRVLIDCERTKYPNTGLYHFCLSLGNALIEQHDKQQDELFFYVPPSSPALFGKDQHYIVQHPLHKFFQPGTGRFDVWHSTHQNSSYHPHNKKSRVLLTVHDLNFLIERKEEPDKIKKYLRIIQQNIDRANHIVCISDFTRQTVVEHLSLNGKPIQVIYNGCNINEFPGYNSTVYKPAKPFIFSLGTLLKKKNFHVLPCLLKDNDYELVISGLVNKQYESAILATAKLHGVADRVKLTGPVSEADKYWYYKNCMAFAFPSLAEGFGFPLVEAMYYGKPVFISRLTSLPEIGGDLAYYFDDFDPSLMQQVFKKGMQHYIENNAAAKITARALQFSWSAAAEKYLAAYRTMYNK
ncbi:MAG: glycosyltransferase family 1 protein [Chitinophagaceae bacterium]